MTKKDVPVVHRLLGEYLKQFHLAPVLDEEEVAHFLIPQENIIHTYLVEVSTGVRYSEPSIRLSGLQANLFVCRRTAGGSDQSAFYCQ